MISEDQVANHYDQANLGSAIEAAVEAMGLSTSGLTVADLAGVDEFHAGGRWATGHLLDQLDLTPDLSVLDVGCGIGGAARFCASTYGTTVTGVDLTPGFIEVAKQLTGWVGLEDKVSFQLVNAAELPFKKKTFDAAYLLHVGMNVADKTGLFASIAKVLRPGGRFGIYDLMRSGVGDLSYPLPWASLPSTSFLVPPSSYESSLVAAGFEVTATEDRTEAVLEFLTDAATNRAAAEGEGPPPLGLHLIMGPETGSKLANMIRALRQGLIAPVELVAVKAS
ncbi:MAG: methyltransferase domain-containing protein [Actinomycetia bacterium]|nr:methyltransferase domain-containing protein [Actinomycetes bacterium]